MSLSREFAAFVANLTYEDLPPEVVDRTKGVTLQALSSALVAHRMPGSRQALTMMQEEETGGAGAATVLCKPAEFIHPARVAVSGRSVGPSLYHMLEVLGKERVLARFERARSHVA